MKDYIIMTDSGCDLPQEIIELNNIKVVPMALTIADKTYRHFYDCRELSMEDFYNEKARLLNYIKASFPIN